MEKIYSKNYNYGKNNESKKKNKSARKKKLKNCSFFFKSKKL